MEDQLKEDCHSVKLMLKSKTNLAGDDVVKAFCLDTRSINNPKPRLFLIKFQNEGIKWKVLKVTKGLKSFKDHKCYSIFVSVEDRILSERQEIRELNLNRDETMVKRTL